MKFEKKEQVHGGAHRGNFNNERTDKIICRAENKISTNFSPPMLEVCWNKWIEVIKLSPYDMAMLNFDAGVTKDVPTM